MEMVIKIDSQAFLASLQDVVRQIQAGCTQVTWQLGMQASEPTSIHSLRNAEDLVVPACTVDKQPDADSKCQVTPDDSIPHHEMAHRDSPRDLVGQTMLQQVATPHGSGVVKRATAIPNAVAQFDTAIPVDVTQSTTPTPLPVAPTATLTAEVQRQSATAMLKGHELAGEVATEEATQGERSTGGDIPVGSSPSTADLIVKQEETSYTLEAVRARLAQLMRKGEGAFVRAVLACYGATRLPQVAPKDYQDIMKKVGEKDAM